ncbi:hypothetical protein JTB14_016311 [Gonioctena quinquepunctata]|nr:hypothetical protein JTB14_016311 [Gonioctena quinquepunctata]
MKNAALIFLIQMICVVNSYKILCVFTLPAKSHFTIGNALVQGLVSAGHDVTTVTSFEVENTSKNENLRSIVLTGLDRAKDIGNMDFIKRGQINPIISSIGLNQLATWYTNATFEDDKFKELIDSDEKFDVVILEQFLNDAMKVLAWHYQVPLIVFSAVGANDWINPLVGNPSPPSYIPDRTLSYSYKMDFWQRFRNSFMWCFHELVNNFLTHPEQEKIMRKHFPNSPDFKSIAQNISLVLLNSHESFSQPIPQVPTMINIGGIHLKSPGKLPDDLKNFMDTAEEGVVYFSLGSLVNPSNLGNETKQALMDTLGGLKQKVLWKYSEDDFPEKPANVRLGKWFPQQDILAHPNMKLFITHGGLQSIIESVYHGVPILGLPICADQKMNVARAVADGYGKYMVISEITKESFSKDVNMLLSDPRYQENAKKRSLLMHDRPLKPKDLAVYWIEFVIRHQGTQHLRVAALDLTWYQYFLLDILAFIMFIRKGKINLPSAKGEGQGKKTRNPLGSKEKENQSTANNNSSDEEECFCLVCLELFSNSLSH